MYKKFCLVLPFGVSLLFLAGCVNNTEWTAFVYPDGLSIESTWIIQGGFSSLDECRNFVSQQKGGVEFDYECGSNCRIEESIGGIHVCEETLN